MELLREFKPALLFLGKFLALYFLGNIFYGVYIESFDNKPDNVTAMVTAQTSWLLNTTGYDTSCRDVEGAAKVALVDRGATVLNVFEGCNGVNVMIVFVAFLFAFGGPAGTMALFIPIGLLVIHLVNLLRISLLFYLARTDSAQFYYYHKYFFTATLYLIVFGLWALWVMHIYESRRREGSA